MSGSCDWKFYIEGDRSETTPMYHLTVQDYRTFCACLPEDFRYELLFDHQRATRKEKTPKKQKAR